MAIWDVFVHARGLGNHLPLAVSKEVIAAVEQLISVASS
jgi:hypothetical protein